MSEGKSAHYNDKKKLDKYRTTQRQGGNANSDVKIDNSKNHTFNSDLEE